MRITHYLVLATALICCNKKEDKELSSFDQIQTQILNTSCAISGCHQSSKDVTFLQHGLVLEKSTSYDNLINKNPKNGNALVDKLLLVKPFKAEESLLYHKIHFADHHQSDYGNLMPLGLPPLYEGQVEFIRRWIEAGAPKAGKVVDESLLEDKTIMVEPFEPLEAPPAGKGIQVVIPEFDVAPNFEREFFVYKKLGNTQDIYVNRFQIKMRPNSHHFLMYDFNDQLPLLFKPSLDVIRDIRNPNGTSIPFNMITMAYHTYVAGSQTTYSDFQLPENVVFMFPAGVAMDLNSHYVNKSTTTIKGEIFMNLYTVELTPLTKIARPINFGNQSFNLPPKQRTVIAKDYLFDRPVKIISLTSHTHQLGEKFVIKIKGGTRNGEVVYTSSDWHHPETTNYSSPILLNSNEGLTSEITYNNTKDVAIKFGLTSEDEMGIIFGYFIEN
jgi:hypothetical protein